MYKGKLSIFAIVCMVGILGINPITTFAAETNTESVTLSETDKNQNEKKAAIDEKMKNASKKWQTLTAKQKAEVYALIENEMQVEIKLMDKFVEFGLMEKVDAETIKTHMTERLNKLKESGEFPFLRQKGKK